MFCSSGSQAYLAHGATSFELTNPCRSNAFDEPDAASSEWLIGDTVANAASSIELAADHGRRPLYKL